jgi:CheY-like chemotaxis protein
VKHKSRSKIEANRYIRQQVENIKKERMKSEKVVSLSDFRELKARQTQKTILVVDDDDIMRHAIKRILDAENHNVLLAGDGVELSKILETNRLDMILLDVNLPWVDGIELCRIIKSHPSLKHVPIIMISARKEKEDIEAGIQAGAEEYVTKPFDVDHVTGSISRIFNQKFTG